MCSYALSRHRSCEHGARSSDSSAAGDRAKQRRHRVERGKVEGGKSKLDKDRDSSMSQHDSGAASTLALALLFLCPLCLFHFFALLHPFSILRRLWCP